jgi:broad specificity phosphatase PhoE
MENNRKIIFLIRHGNTAFNKKKIFRGHYDIPLDEVGIKQAEKTGKFLREIDFDIIYSSPLSRAYKTAEVIKGYQAKDVKVVKEYGFTDLNFGDWEGKGYEEISSIYSEIFNLWLKNPYKAAIPNGEIMHDAQKRAWKTLNEIVTNDSYSFVTIVTHRIITKLLISKILDIGEAGFWKINQDPCCINIIEYNYGTFFISKLNYNFHITNLKDSFFKTD